MFAFICFPLRRVQARRLVAVLIATALSLLAMPAQSARAQVATQSQEFAFTGYPQVFSVPEGVTEVIVEAWGAQGGGGGGGGYTKALVPVLPFEPLYVYVGGQGTEDSGNLLDPNFYIHRMRGNGGWNGGGSGGVRGTTCLGCIGAFAGGGGGASDVRQGGVHTSADTFGFTDSRVVVAGGGGGWGGAGGGGSNSGQNGPNGGAATVQCNSSGGGGGGGGGYSGQTFGGGSGGYSSAYGGGPGTSGTATTGGAGGYGDSASYNGPSGPAWSGTAPGGGGGGGGFSAGGGGGGGGVCGEWQGNINIAYPGGGGGGAGYVAPSATELDGVNGVRTGNGRVVVSWEEPFDAVPTVPFAAAPAAGHVFTGTDPQLFRISATDSDDAAYAGQVEIRQASTVVRTFGTTLSASGQESLGGPTPRLGRGSYEWRARACDPSRAEHCGDWTAWRPFSVLAAPRDADNQGPSAVSAVYPPAGHTFAVTDPVQFTLQASDPEGEPYSGRVRVTGPGGAEPDVFTSPAASGQQSQGVALKPLNPGVYTWTAEACDAGSGTCVATAPQSFTVSALPSKRPPSGPELVAPANGHAFVSRTPQTFTVRAVDPDGAPYSAQVVAVDGSGQQHRLPPVFAPSGQNAVTVAAPPLPPGSYTWTAEICSPVGPCAPAAGAPSRTFTVLPNRAPAVPVIDEPVAGHVFGASDAQVFRATSSDPDGDFFHVEFAVFEGTAPVPVNPSAAAHRFTSVPGTAQVTGTPVPAFGPGAYEVVGRACDPSAPAVCGAWSAATPFTVAAASSSGGRPQAPQLLSPSDGGVFGPTTLQTFTIRVNDPDQPSDRNVGRIEIVPAGESFETSLNRRLLFTGAQTHDGTTSATAEPPLPAGAYQWRASTVDVPSGSGSGSGEFGPVSEVRGFTVTAANQPPPNATPTAPADGHVVGRLDSRTVSFSATATDPQGDPWVAEFEVTPSGSSAQVYASDPASSGATATHQVQLTPGAYTWRVRPRQAVDGATGAWSASRSLTVLADAAPTAAQTSPGNGHQYLHSQNQVLTASATDPEDDQVQLRFQVLNSSGTVTVEHTTGWVASGSAQSYTVSPKRGTGSYTWRVEARSLNSLWSAAVTRSFSVLANRAPSEPVREAPAADHMFPHGGAQVFQVRATDPDGDAYVAEFEVRSSSQVLLTTFRSATTASGASASASPPATLPAGAYEWRTRATGGAGSPAGVWTGWQAFHVGPKPPNQAPDAPVFETPAHEHVFAPGAEQRFTVTVSDIDGDVLHAAIEFERWNGSAWEFAATLNAAPAASGSQASAAFTPLDALGSGTYRWRAHARDEAGSGTYGAWTTGPVDGNYRTFTVS